MIVGFGFGSPLTALLMLVVTASLSYFFFKAIRGRRNVDWTDDRGSDISELRRRKRAYYYEQRQRARELMDAYDLTDQEIEERINRELDGEK
jgi:hypothetical protein